MRDRLTESEQQTLYALLRLAGESQTIITVQPCPGGGNNRVFRIELTNKSLLAKWYFHHPTDNRDRLTAEFSFLRYAESLGLSTVPKALSASPEEKCALYEWIWGCKLNADAITLSHVEAAARFFNELNAPQRFVKASLLANASDASFSLKAHQQSIGRRLDRLIQIQPETAEDQAVLAISKTLQRDFQVALENLKQQASKSGIDLNTELEPNLRCISPSDFGFHNALLKPDGNLCFLDFEYAGWDDPAKMAADFFCQPQVPVNMEYLDQFLHVALQFTPESAFLMERTRMLLPLFRLKWCAIMLNEFLPETALRRQFAAPRADFTERKRQQLNKAIQFYNLHVRASAWPISIF